ncbi:hypothetical protein FPCIR_12192 [Fusarium pseudocircinatum]|uniref:WSC domain-containing protein n=1 Tax=Fusarium pseudocircinatum TaxID=56676 RepID=A0A8H5KQ78_9HYPO|nr:hypothetical protein FPCIR_12192 [Fusarium pseudocircinatum]
MGFHLSRLVALVALLRASYAFSVTAVTDGDALASAIFGAGIIVISASFTGASDSSGTFTDGPFGMGDAAILTSGTAVGALLNGGHFVDNGAAGSVTYCGGSSSNNAAILTADVMLLPGFGGMRFEVVMASEESGGVPDPIGIFVDNQNYALDGNGNRLTAMSPWLSQPLIIVPPNSVTSYASSSPPYWIDVPLIPGGPQTVVVAICDASDAVFDSALMIKAEACVECNEPFRLAYVTTTTTLAAGDTPYTSTITASGTVSGTIEIGVAAAKTTITTEEPTTTTVADETTTTSEEPSTSTTQDESTKTSQEATSTAEDTNMATTRKETTTMTTLEETTTTTAKETTSTASGTATDITTTINTGTTTETTIDVMETSTEASSSVTLEELPNSTMAITVTTSVERIDTVTEYSTIVTDSITATTSDTTTKTAPNSSNESTTSLETTSLSKSSIDSTTTSREEVQVSSTILAVPTSTGEVTLSLSSGLSSESAIIIAFTAAESPVLTAELAPILEMTTAESLETSAAEETKSSADAISNSWEETSFSDAITSTAQDTPSPATPTAATSSAVPSNLAVIGTFKFFGCLGSAAGYPSFDLIGEGPDMTTAECARLGKGRTYIGIYQRSCYAADILDSAETVTNGRCDLPCPGDPGLFCGGVILTDSTPDSLLRRQDASPGILLTFTETFVESVITLEPSVPVTRSQGTKPVTPPFPTVSYNAGNLTRTEAVVPMITTVTYTIVDPNNPSDWTITEYCTTLRPPLCRRCQYQKPPTVEMTIEMGCNRCGHNGENAIAITVPAGAAVAGPAREYAAHETHIVEHYEPRPDTQGTQLKNSSPTAKVSHGQAELSAVPLGGNGYSDAPNPTFHRRPAPTHTPVIVPDASIVVVSGAVVKAIDGMLMAILLMVGFIFLL